MKKVTIALFLIIGSLIFCIGQNAKSVNNINSGMPNRISMNVTVGKQTQGATFGEKVNAGIVDGDLLVVFPNQQAFRINTTSNKITQLTSTETTKVNAGLHAAGGALAQGASLLGGALPGGAVISAAVSKVSESTPIWESKESVNSILLPSTLSDGEYFLNLVIRSDSKAKKGSKIQFGILVEGKTYKVISANS